MVVQVMRLNSSEDRGNEHRINGGPRLDYYYPLPETSTLEMEVEGHCFLLQFRGGFWYIKPGGNDYKYS